MHEVESMFSSNRVVPWHGLGNILSGYPESREQVLAEAGLDWQVATFPVTVELGGRNQDHRARQTRRR